MLNLISIVIGIVFVLLLFSLLATTIMEMLSGLLSLRGKNLINAIRTMLGDRETDVFVSHPFFKQLGERANLFRFLRKGSLPPSYIRPNTFTAILMDILQANTSNEAQKAISQLPESKMKEVLSFLYREARGDIATFRQKVEEWFSEVMERASEWYLNSVRIWLIGVGLTIAVLFNVDVIGIYTNLSANATLREYLADSATQFVQTAPEPKSIDSVAVNPDFYAARDRMNKLLDENISAIRSPLGLGWDNVVWPEENKTQWWLYKAIGWLTTALAVSLGAKFWFDLLRQLVSFRNGGSSGQQASPPPVIINNPPAGSAPVLTQPASVLFESTRQAEPPKTDNPDEKEGDG